MLDSDKVSEDATFHAKVDVVEWLGNEAYAYVPFDAPPEVEKQLLQLERDLDGESLRTQLVISLDGASRISEGDEATIWVDARKIHHFDPATGENLTMDAEHAGTVPGGDTMAKAEEVGREQDEVQPGSDQATT